MRTLLVLLAALAASPVAAADDPAADEKAVRDVVARYYAAYAKKDVDGVMAVWSAGAPEAAVWRGRLKTVFAQTGPLTVKSVEVRKVVVTGERARADVRAEVVGAGPDGKPHLSLGVVRRSFGLIREGGGWKVTSYDPASAPLARALATAGTPEERRRLMDADPDLLDGDLVRPLMREGLALADAWLTDRLAAAYFDAGVEAAERAGDRALLAACYLTRGEWRGRRSGWADALADARRALPLVRGQRTNPAEARAVHVIGAAHLNTGDPRQAIPHLEAALLIRRELRNPKDEADTLVALAAAYEKLDRDREAAEFYADAYELRRELNDRKGGADILRALGELYLAHRRLPNAENFYTVCLRMRRTLGDARAVAEALNGLGRVYQELGRYREALDLHQEEVLLRRELDDRPAWPPR